MVTDLSLARLLLFLVCSSIWWTHRWLVASFLFFHECFNSCWWSVFHIWPIGVLAKAYRSLVPNITPNWPKIFPGKLRSEKRRFIAWLIAIGFIHFRNCCLNKSTPTNCALQGSVGARALSTKWYARIGSGNRIHLPLSQPLQAVCMSVSQSWHVLR